MTLSAVPNKHKTPGNIFRDRDKETRNATLRGMFLSARVKIYRPGVALDLHAEILSFPGCIHDDMVDALGLTAQQLIEL